MVAMSAGNHAQGVAYHATRLGIPATIVMPKLTPFLKVEKTTQFGARVLLEGDSVDEAAAFAHRLAAERDLTSRPTSTTIRRSSGQAPSAWRCSPTRRSSRCWC